MKILLDDETLKGPQAVRITIRPERIAVPVDSAAALIRAITFECQLWGGANTPLLPASQAGELAKPYLDILAGSAVEGVRGMEGFGLFNLREGRVSVRMRPHGDEMDGFGRQLVAALLPYHSQQEYKPVDVVQLVDGDPWRGIYAACLGLLPDRPDRHVLRHGRLIDTVTFEDFVNIRRQEAVGSLSDLIERMVDDTCSTPRQLSMIHLQSEHNGSYGIGAESGVLPEPNFPRRDAGPNVLVVCSGDNVEDLALLWNLRSAHGDYHPLPVGIPLEQLRPDTIQALVGQHHISEYGISARHVYVTSASIEPRELSRILGDSGSREFRVVDSKSLLTLGSPAGWARDDVVVWADGKASFVPLPTGSKEELIENGHFGRLTRMQADLRVLSSPFPSGDDVRISAPNSSFYSGAVSLSVGRRRSEPIEVLWPGRMLAARAIARNRGLEIKESEPGRSARIALNELTDLWEISFLAHAPLLGLLEQMAARSGFGWLRQRARDLNRLDIVPTDAVPPTTDQLPERAFADFKRVLGNSPKATKHWLMWAELAGLIVKGFQLQCPRCSAKQWIPVAAFSPPIICRGCAEEMDTPFGDRVSLDFTYRISERLRRVYEYDAMGHLLTMRFFNSVFSRFEGSDLIGMHPGLNIHKEGNSRTEGEADVLMLFQDAAFVPVEVKRSFSGVVPSEVGKLDYLAKFLDAPWSAIAVCEYGGEAPREFLDLENRDTGEVPFRLLLSYDRLLDPAPVWSLGNDPFEWSPLTREQIQEREKSFVVRLARRAEQAPFNWLADEMLNRPSMTS